MDVRGWKTWAVVGGVVVALWVAFGIGRATAGGADPHAGHVDAPASDAPTIWTCSMHPQIQLPKPGKCPICGMDLIPVTTRGGGAGPRTLVMDAAAKALAAVAVAPVERRFATKTVRMVGKVEYDETRVRTIAAWVDGRIDRLFVDYTGTPVRKGDHLAELYSPALLTAQEELQAARRQVDAETPETSAFLRASNQRALESARDKLRLWGITSEQVAAIERGATPDDHLELTAPIGGVVIHKGVHEGMYVKTGAVMYRIADLSEVWVQLEAFESDLAWLRYGQDVSVETEAFAGEVFHGRVAFIAPEVEARTRTVKVRVNVPNPDGRLRPGMFVHGRVQARVAGGGRVMEPALAGKWICPMHPAEIADTAGACRLCGMPLVRVEELGYVPAAEQDEARPLVVPATAVLRTGRRAVVYVEVPNTAEPTYQGREIVLGPRADDVYLVRGGLQEGERVVVRGNFKIDSALQIQAEPSMMSMPPGPVRDRPAGSDAARAALQSVYAAYLQTQQALAADALSDAQAGFRAIGQAVAGVDHALFTGRIHGTWMEQSNALRTAAQAGAGAADLAAARVAFRDASTAVLALLETFGHAGPERLARAFCPMAFDNVGAAWAQAGEQIANPYFGSEMLRCGDLQEQFPPQPPRAVGPGFPTPPSERGTGPAPGQPRTPGERPAPAPGATPAARTWTCSMHPQVRSPKPGKCPICGMDLVVVAPDAGAGGGR